MAQNPIKNIQNNLADIKQSSTDDRKGIYTGYFAFERIVYYMERCSSASDIPVSIACKHIHDELLIFYRAIILAKKYFEYAILHFPYCVDTSYIEFIKEMLNTIEKVNFYLLKGSISCSQETFRKSKILIEDIARLYNKLGG